MAKKYNGGLKFGQSSGMFSRGGMPDHSSVESGPLNSNSPAKFDLSMITNLAKKAGDFGKDGLSPTDDPITTSTKSNTDNWSKGMEKNPNLNNITKERDRRKEAGQNTDREQNQINKALGSKVRREEEAITPMKPMNASMPSVEMPTTLSKVEMPTTKEADKPVKKDNWLKRTGKKIGKAVKNIDTDKLGSELQHLGVGISKSPQTNSIMAGYMDSKNKQRASDETSEANNQIAVSRNLKNQGLRDKINAFKDANSISSTMKTPNGKKFASTATNDDGSDISRPLGGSVKVKGLTITNPVSGGRDLTTSSGGSKTKSYFDDDEFQFNKKEMNQKVDKA